MDSRLQKYPVTTFSCQAATAIKKDLWDVHKQVKRDYPNPTLWQSMSSFYSTGKYVIVALQNTNNLLMGTTIDLTKYHK